MARANHQRHNLIYSDKSGNFYGFQLKTGIKRKQNHFLPWWNYKIENEKKGLLNRPFLMRTAD